MTIPGDVPRYIEPLISDTWAETGAAVKHDADWQNIQYKLPGETTWRVLCGEAAKAKTQLLTDISGIDRRSEKDRKSGSVSSLKQATGSLWPGDIPSLTVTTLEDKVDAMDGLRSLREVVDYAERCPTMAQNKQYRILFSESIYSWANFVSCRWERTQIDVKDLPYPIVLESPKEKTIVLDGQGKWRHFRVCEGNRLDLNGVLLVNGFGANYGSPYPGTDGGSVLNYGTLNALNCHFSGNSAGGHVDTLRKILELSGQGGAIWTGPKATTFAHWSSFSRNKAAKGGAMAGSGEQTVASVTFSDNQAGKGTSGGSEGQGGACYVTGGDAVFVHCTMVGNDAGYGGAGGAVYAWTGDSDTETPVHFANVMAVANKAGPHMDDIHVDGSGAVDFGCVACGVTNGTAKTWFYADSSYIGVVPTQLFPNATETSAQAYRVLSGVGHIYYPVFETCLAQGARIGLKREGKYDGIYFEYKPNDWQPIRGPGGRLTPKNLYNDNRDQLYNYCERFFGAVSVIGTGGGDIPPPLVTVDDFVVTQATWTAFVETVNRLAANGPKEGKEITFAGAAANATITAGDQLVLTAFTNVPLSVRGPVTFKGKGGRRFIAMNYENDAVFRNVRFVSGGSSTLDIGGAIWGLGGNHLSTSNCVFKSNKAQWGGAVGMDGQSVLSFYKTDFTGNQAEKEAQGNDVYQERGTMDVAGGTFDPSGFISYDTNEAKALTLKYSLTVAGVSTAATSDAGLAALLADDEPVTSVAGPSGGSMARMTISSVNAAVTAAYADKPWYTVTAVGGVVKAVLNEEATPQAAELTVSPGESGEISLVPGNVKPGLWYALERADSPVGPYVAVESSWVQATAQGTLEKPLVAPAEGASGFYRVVARESR